MQRLEVSGRVCFNRARCTTFVCVLSGELGDGIADLGADRVVGLVGEALQQLCADGVALGGLQGQKQVGRLPRGRLARLGRLAPEDDGGEGSRLVAASALLGAAGGGGGVRASPAPARSAPTGP